jgi:hypothetical protein
MNEREQAWRRWAGRIGGALFALGVINFIAFVVLSLAWGGDALNGTAQNGRFYLRNKRHLVEVSEVKWRVNRAHAISVLITHPLAVVGGGLLLNYSQRCRRT